MQDSTQAYSTMLHPQSPHALRGTTESHTAPHHFSSTNSWMAMPVWRAPACRIK